MMEPQQHEDDNASSQSGLPKRRRLADVLMRATLASQQKPQDSERLSQRDTVGPFNYQPLLACSSILMSSLVSYHSL